jgi:hypothetical protein
VTASVLASGTSCRNTQTSVRKLLAEADARIPPAAATELQSRQSFRSRSVLPDTSFVRKKTPPALPREERGSRPKSGAGRGPRTG